jgi:23S rRNA (cytidine1920-2'-O)/16S rRNA (cytidine1409-2'-O)-methyltransferase
VLAGEVFVSGSRVDKVGTLVSSDAIAEVRGRPNPFVSRGGLKLAGALDAFRLDVRGLRCLDVGASTGGFTDCLLQRGAAEVVAVDVGYGQLADKLRRDPRVRVMERTNARSLTPVDVQGVVDLTVVDASFIGLAKLLPALAACTRERGQLVALVKPQFEVGKKEAARGRGVVRDEATRAQAVTSVAQSAKAAGFEVSAHADSVLPGPKGNREVFLHATRL